jgi:hypothetical protein
MTRSIKLEEVDKRILRVVLDINGKVGGKDSGLTTEAAKDPFSHRLR